MSARGLIDKILSSSIDKLPLMNKMPPNKEALLLYREILKLTNKMDWRNEKGEIWGDIIRKSARQEFELAREEKDPLLIMKMILTSREAIVKVKEKMNDAYFTLNRNVENSREQMNPMDRETMGHIAEQRKGQNL